MAGGEADVGSVEVTSLLQIYRVTHEADGKMLLILIIPCIFLRMPYVNHKAV